jgi:Reverse transcriptase (RNA-dependent DNA polymerase)
MYNHPITYDELSLAISKLQDKKSLDLNNNSMFLVKKILPVIALPLIHVFYRSLLTGTVPKKLKIAKVIPIFKAGDPSDPNNYRPISLLCTFSKILEKIVFIRLTEYLDTNGLLSDHQFGFRPKHSTFHPMLQIVNPLRPSRSISIDKKWKVVMTRLFILQS